MRVPQWAIMLILRKMGVIPTFTKLKDAINGKKTYLLAVSAIIAAAIKYAGDGNVAEFLTAVWAALTSITMRSAIG